MNIPNVSLKINKNIQHIVNVFCIHIHKCWNFTSHNAIIPCINFLGGDYFMMVIIGAIIVIGVIYLLLKRHESRMVLIAAGILMAVIAGKPMAALDAFAKSMTNAGLINFRMFLHGFCYGYEIYRL